MYLHEDGCRYRRPIATKLYDDPIDIFDHHLYDKGGRVLHMLRQVLGDDLFWKSLRHYLEKHRHGVVETRDLARAIEDATGRVLDWFFGQWVIDGAGHPELKVSMSWDADHGVMDVTVEQTQKVEGRTPLFRLPATLRFRVGDRDVDVPAEVTEQRHTFHVRLDTEPTQAIFDPAARSWPPSTPTRACSCGPTSWPARPSRSTAPTPRARSATRAGPRRSRR